MNLKNKLKQSIHNHKYFVFMFLLFIFVYIYTSIGKLKTDQPTETLSVDTLIPAGYTLVPIELENINAISSLIDGFGVVDIYVGKAQSGSSKKLLQKVKILRAPNNPQAYSILVPDRLSAVLFKYEGPFYAVIQNKAESSSNPEVNEATTTQKSVKIEYNGGS